MKPIEPKKLLCVVGTALLMLLGCAQKMWVPTRIFLNDYGRIGMIEFSSNAEGNLQQFVTQKFVEYLQSSQAGVAVLELGDEKRVLKTIQRDLLDIEALQTIGKEYNIDAVITGHLNVTNVKPKVELSSLLSSMSVRADVEASLSAKLLETGSGATLWTNSVRGEETVAHVTIISGGPANFDAGDPENAYGRLAHWLAAEITKDFREHYERK